MIKTIRYVIFASLLSIPLTSMSAGCQQSDGDEKFACENYESIKKNIDSVTAEAGRVMPGNSSLKSLNKLYGLQIKNCNNFKCRSDVASKYYMVVSSAIKSKPSHVDKKLTLEQACEATTQMRYYSAVAAFSPLNEARRAEVNAKRFGREIMVYDIAPYVQAYLDPASVRFRQAYMQGETALISMFTPMMGNCQSVPASSIPTLAKLVRSDGIEFDSLIKVYQR